VQPLGPCAGGLGVLILGEWGLMRHALPVNPVETVAAPEQVACGVRPQLHLVELGTLGAGLTMHRASLGTESNCPAVPFHPETPHQISPTMSENTSN
jgi:hypothetical protein